MYNKYIIINKLPSICNILFSNVIVPIHFPYFQDFNYFSLSLGVYFGKTIFRLPIIIIILRAIRKITIHL